MTPTSNGSIKLFRFAGIDVFLHWSWFVVAAVMLKMRGDEYSSFLWNFIEYLALFTIVLMHEFGHSLACRQVGGQANQIVLWPLGGVAYVAPPPRPGPVLWSIAAGPLVNVILMPVLLCLDFLSGTFGLAEAAPSVSKLIANVLYINWLLLCFNLLPVYPLDGGQILRSLLWFPFGRGRSLMITTIIGFIGVAGLLLFALQGGSVWMIVLSAFIALQCWRGFQQARALLQAERLPRHSGYSCPNCQAAPPAGEFWLCGNCRQPFDTFASQSFCPRCASQFNVTQCMDCGHSRPMEQWITGRALPPKVQL